MSLWLTELSVLNEMTRSSSAEIKMRRKDVPFKPWISRSILRSIKTRDKLRQRVKACPTDTFARKTFNTYRYKLRECLREAERRHMEKSLKAAEDPRASWQIINHYIRGKSSRKVFPSQLRGHDISMNDLNAANQFFCGYWLTGEGGNRPN